MGHRCRLHETWSGTTRENHGRFQADMGCSCPWTGYDEVSGRCRRQSRSFLALVSSICRLIQRRPYQSPETCVGHWHLLLPACDECGGGESIERRWRWYKEHFLEVSCCIRSTCAKNPYAAAIPMIKPSLVLVGFAHTAEVLSGAQVLELDVSCRRTREDMSTIVRVAKFAASAT